MSTAIDLHQHPQMPHSGHGDGDAVVAAAFWGKRSLLEA
jgi:hypothetical protein